MKIVKHYWFVAIALITMISFSSGTFIKYYKIIQLIHTQSIAN